MTSKRILYILPYLSAATRLSFVAGGLTVRIEQLVIVLLFAAIILGLLVGKKIYYDGAALFLTLMWGISFYASIHNAPDSKYSVIQTVNIVTISFGYLVVSHSINDRKTFNKYLFHSLNAAFILSCCGTLFFLISFIVRKELLGVNLTQNELAGVAFGTYFTMREPNYYGSFMLMPFFISFILLFGKKERPDIFSSSFLKRVFIASCLGMLLSFTRAVWLAAIIGLAIYYLGSWKKIVNNWLKILGAVTGVYIILFLLINVFKFSFLAYKLNNFIQTDTGSGEGRLILYFQALDNLVDSGNWWFGNGTYSFASFFTYGDYDSDQNAWIGNWLITILHDSGIIGLITFFCFFGLLISYSFKKSKTDDSEIRIGLRLSLVGILIAFFFSQGTTFLYPWILFGLVSAHKKLSKKENADKVITNDQLLSKAT